MAELNETNENPIAEFGETIEEAGATPKSRLPLMVAAGLILVLGSLIFGIAYALVGSQRVYIEDSSIAAPEIVLAPTVDGTLQSVSVNVGDAIPAYTVVAQVGTELLKTTTAAIVIRTDTVIGSQVTSATPVVTVIDPTQLRVVGQVKEDKGLKNIQVGDRAVFTVDAYGSQKFEGVVDEVSPTARAGDVVFSVSDKRQEQSFDVKVAYDQTKYPQLKNGMSAKIWVYTK